MTPRQNWSSTQKKNRYANLNKKQNVSKRTATAGQNIERKKRWTKRTSTAGDVRTSMRDENVDTTFLTGLDLGPDHSGIDGASVGIYFSVRRNSIGDAAANAFADVLLHNPGNLRHLDLSGNDIGDVGAACIAEVIKNQASITTLLLSGAKLGGKGLRALATGLAFNTTIVHCDLCDNTNDPGKGGADDIGTGSSLQALLERNGTLTTLALGSNHLKVKLPSYPGPFFNILPLVITCPFRNVWPL